MQQAAPVLVVRPGNYQSDAGQGALVFAIIITLFALVCGCWWSIVCSIPGMVFASSVSCVYYNLIIADVCQGCPCNCSHNAPF